jgi:hypothetical protein
VTDGTARALARAIESSATMKIVKPVVAGSVVCRLLLTAVTTVWRTVGGMVSDAAREQPWEDPRRDVRRLDALIGDSRIVQALTFWSLAPATARDDARSMRPLASALALAARDQVRGIGAGIVFAVLTHTFLFAVLGVPVGTLGWSVRAILGAAGATGAWRPEPWVAAWRDRFTSRR